MNSVDQAARRAAEKIKEYPISWCDEKPCLSCDRKLSAIANIIATEFKGLADERDRLAKDVNELNALLREVGWGQGEIDSAATVAEENERLRALLVRSRVFTSVGLVHKHFDAKELLADIDAALALGNNNG